MANKIKLKLAKFNEVVKKEKWTDGELAIKMGVSTTQIWRARLPDEDHRHNDPGGEFIAGALAAFPYLEFNDLFFLVNDLRARKNEEIKSYVKEDE
ncbi:hypothetical protein [Pelosinus propionicus]|uniref:hypothetical protein n=1 Tax=Pelosinus propionicus TaxID=380084 RepID=UPI00158745E3|nr:hypothetical protein [Pelosinus propionicus]